MHTPIIDFLKKYNDGKNVRFHMPGHKGKDFLGCEKFDITEIKGADSLYLADGIISESEDNATALFGSGRTFYSTEGSSQCIRAMLYLALVNRPEGRSDLILSARNAHKAFLYASALLDFKTVWLYGDKPRSLLSTRITPSYLENVLKGLLSPPAAVYVTSPDYLGGRADIKGLAEVCHRYGTILLLDNAHGAYLKFLPVSEHPLDLGADMCCDSAHKTLPVLTGGAYLHIGKNLPETFIAQAKNAMAVFGSTSPSYLTLASLDCCNEYINNGYKDRLKTFLKQIERTKSEIADNGWTVEESDPLKITISVPKKTDGEIIAERLRKRGVECEFADKAFIVFMATPENSDSDLTALSDALGKNSDGKPSGKVAPLFERKRALSVRNALLSASETVDVKSALGRICSAPTVSCPPAVPIVASGEIIDEEAIDLFEYYGIKKVEVVKTEKNKVF